MTDPRIEIAARILKVLYGYGFSNAEAQDAFTAILSDARVDARAILDTSGEEAIELAAAAEQKLCEDDNEHLIPLALVPLEAIDVFGVPFVRQQVLWCDMYSCWVDGEEPTEDERAEIEAVQSGEAPCPLLESDGLHNLKVEGAYEEAEGEFELVCRACGGYISTT